MRISVYQEKKDEPCFPLQNEQIESAKYVPLGKQEKAAHAKLLALTKNIKCPKKNRCNKSQKELNTSGYIATDAPHSQVLSVEFQNFQSSNANTGKSRGTK